MVSVRWVLMGVMRTFVLSDCLERQRSQSSPCLHCRAMGCSPSPSLSRVLLFPCALYPQLGPWHFDYSNKKQRKGLGKTSEWKTSFSNFLSFASFFVKCLQAGRTPSRWTGDWEMSFLAFLSAALWADPHQDPFSMQGQCVLLLKIHRERELALAWCCSPGWCRGRSAGASVPHGWEAAVPSPRSKCSFRRI